MLDVAIIGGGPGGLSAARRLAADGWSVTVFEEHERIGTPVHCTGVLAEDVIASLDLPADAVLNPLSTVRFVAPAGHSFDYTTATTEAVVIDREAFDDALARRAEAAGATHRPRRARHRGRCRHRTASIVTLADGETRARARRDSRLRRELRVSEAGSASACRRRSCSRRSSSCPPIASATSRSISDPRSRRRVLRGRCRCGGPTAPSRASA